jgi:glutathione S-transferase
MREWPQKMVMIEQQLATTGGYIAGPDFTLADIAIGLTVNRWFASPLPEMEHPGLPETSAYYERLSQRPAYLAHGRNGAP